MYVKIGDAIYDSEEQPIMIVLNHEENEYLRSIEPDDLRIAFYNDDLVSDEEAEAFMDLPGDTEVETR